MKRLWLPMATAVLLLSGCTPTGEPPHPVSPVSSRDIRRALPAGAERPIAKPQAEPTETPQAGPAEKPQTGPARRCVDEFNLPLVIVIEAPQPPPEIQGPSPPIQEERNLP